MENSILDIKQVTISYNRQIGNAIFPVKALLIRREKCSILRWKFFQPLSFEDFFAFCEEIMDDLNFDDSPLHGSSFLFRLNYLTFFKDKKKLSIDFMNQELRLNDWSSSSFNEYLKTFVELGGIV